MTLVNTATHERHPEWTMGGNPRAIEAQEKRGQDQFVNSELLPTEVHGKEKFEELGFKFGDPLDNDPLFCNATMPDGWKKVATDHDMWSDIVDDQGKVRAQVFYKAAFYDRCAEMYFRE